MYYLSSFLSLAGEGLLGFNYRISDTKGTGIREVAAFSANVVMFAVTLA